MQPIYSGQSYKLHATEHSLEITAVHQNMRWIYLFIRPSKKMLT